MKLLFIVLFIALPSAIFAQSNYHEGSVLKNNGDTLKGFINYQEWLRSPRSIDFKINKADKKTLQFDPQTIKGFQIAGMETYIAYTGTISMDKASFPDLPNGLDTTKKQDTIFLKQLVTGSHLTLFYHADDIKTRFFIAETNGAPVELKYYQYYNDENQIVTKDFYKGQLLLYINKYIPGNNKLISKVDRGEYHQSEIETLVDDINNNGIAIKKKSYSRLFAGIAINRTSTEEVNLFTPFATHTTISPKINLGIDVFNNPNVQQFVFRTELSFSYITPQFRYPAISNYVYTFNQYTASVTPQILFNIYNKDNFKVYIDGGIAFNFSAYGNNKLIYQSGSILKKPYDLEPYWSNFPFQVGVTLNKKIEIAFTYAGYAAYTKYSGASVSNQSTCLGVKYLFSRR